MAASDKLLVRAAAESQVGNARGNNEDNVYFNGDFITPHTIRQDFAIKTGDYSDINCFAVFDGMGRNNTGSFASLLAATRLDEMVDRLSYDMDSHVDDLVLRYVQGVNEEVREQIRETGGVRTATTMALVIVENGIVHAYNAGDSRIYLYRDRMLTKISRDHVSAKGQRSVVISDDNIRTGGLSKYLGITAEEGSLEPYRAKPFKIRKGDKFLLCSDGLSDYVEDADIAECLAKRKDPFGYTNELVSLALKDNSADNISAIVIEAVEPGLHITQNMIALAAGIVLFLFGVLAGSIFGYFLGGGGQRVYGVPEDDLWDEFQTVPSATLPPVSAGDVSGSDVSRSDVNFNDTNASTSTSTESTDHPTTTFPTTTTRPIIVDSFKLVITDFTLFVGDTYEIKYEIFPTDTPASAITWTSSDPSKVTVDENGVVTAVAKGSAVITAQVGDLKEKCTVYVRKKN